MGLNINYRVRMQAAPAMVACAESASLCGPQGESDPSSDHSSASEELKECESFSAAPKMMERCEDLQQVQIQKRSAPSDFKTDKPDFRAVLGGQTSFGNWTAQSREVLASFVVGGQLEDARVRQAISGVTISEGTDRDTVYLTLLAWYIL